MKKKKEREKKGGEEGDLSFFLSLPNQPMQCSSLMIHADDATLLVRLEFIMLGKILSFSPLL